MNPQVTSIKEDADILRFTLKGVNVSIANGLRRTILSDIPLAVFKTAPYEQNKANILVNTSRLNNEIIKQRLSCIPVHIKDLTIPLQNYVMEVDVENTSDTIIYVTSGDFKIKNMERGGEYLSDKDVRSIFPRCDMTGYFIDFVRLRPKISEELPGERLHLTCEFSIGTAKEDGMFNAVSTCSYGCSVDEDKASKELEKKKQEWKDLGLKADEVAYEATNWKLLDGQRIIQQDSFDFVIQTIGIYKNQEVVGLACDVLSKKLVECNRLLKTGDLVINPSLTTMLHAFDIVLENEDYTLGKILEYFMYTLFFEQTKALTFCGFKKSHPHDTNSMLRVAYKEGVDEDVVKLNLSACIEEALKVYKKIKRDIA